MQTTNEKGLDATNIKALREPVYSPNSNAEVLLRGQNFEVESISKKEQSTLFAKLALAGHAAHRTQVGNYVCSRWGSTRCFMDYDGLKAFARQLGVKT